jgi:hypothetical protein
MSGEYGNSQIILPTKHCKSTAIAPPFSERLTASIIEYELDTDTLGTFSGEIERQGNAIQCARRKCEWACELLGTEAEYCLASEGSFGPHPVLPFTPCDHELLYFIDRKQGFHLHLSCFSEKTNYCTEVVDSLAALEKLAKTALFPSHALILRPNRNDKKAPAFKGIASWNWLEEAYKESHKHSGDGKVWVETDMRAHLNPSRMRVISELAANFADRLATHCPNCHTPGWGKIGVVKGLRCEYCERPTELVAYEILGCVSCDHRENHPRTDGLEVAPQMRCSRCNP